MAQCYRKPVGMLRANHSVPIEPTSTPKVSINLHAHQEPSEFQRSDQAVIMMLYRPGATSDVACQSYLCKPALSDGPGGL